MSFSVMSFPVFPSPRRLAARLVVTALVVGQAASPLAAEEVKGPNVTQGARAVAAAAPDAAPGAVSGPVSGSVATLALAHELFALGRAHGDALTVLAAARLAASTEVAPGKDFKRSTSGEGPADTGSADADPAVATTAPPAPLPADAVAMFDLALTLAAQDEFLTDVILDAQSATGRGRIGGASAQRASLTPGRTDSWEIPFAGGAYAELAVLGSGLSDLDIVVTDENGNVICYEGGQEDRLYCDFVPSWDGFFFVAVENKGGSDATYDLVTN